jgi:hypothetical protein
MVATSLEVLVAGVPRNTPSDAWFSIPEGEAGQITNALSTIGHALNPAPAGRNIIGDIRGMFDNTVESLKQTIGLASGQQTAWTVIHVTGAAQVYALEQSGLTPYQTKAEALAHNSAQNRNVSSSGKGIDIWNNLDLGNILLRVGEVLLGIVLVGVGIAKLTGTTNFVATAVKAKIP